MGKAAKWGGALFFAMGVLCGLEWLARAGGIHADSPDLFEWVWGMISDVWSLLGFSGVAMIIGAAMFAWGRWGDRVRDRVSRHGEQRSNIVARSDNRQKLSLALMKEMIGGAIHPIDSKVASLEKAITSERNYFNHRIENLSKAIRIRDAESQIEEADAIAVSLGEKLVKRIRDYKSPSGTRLSGNSVL